MFFTRIRLENWMNFLDVDVPLRRRVFLVGPNASGKSNFLNALRFLRDIADPQSGFLRAVNARHGVSQIRSLHARRHSNVALEVESSHENASVWTYRIEFTQDNRRNPVIARETILHGDRRILDRPNEADKRDPRLLGQTHLEQLTANREFRALQDSYAKVRYLHLVPQLVRDPERSVGRKEDPYGGDFLEQVARTTKRTRDARLVRIRKALRIAVPQLKDLKLDQDERGFWHLLGLYAHWRPNAGWQTEDQFSDGTLRLLGLLWALLDGTGPLLLEEPELSLHPGVIHHVPGMMARLNRKSGRQVLVSTHSTDLLSDEGIAPEEVLLLEPTGEDTRVTIAAQDRQVRAMLEGGVPMAEAVIPRTAPPEAHQIELFGE